MNIFKVFSARKRFPEEMASATLGCLLHPKSEHGFGRAFLSSFIGSLGETSLPLANQLRALSDDEILCNLEEDVGSSIVDIVVFLGSFVLAIENKIHDEAFAFGQLEKEYDGLLQKFPDKTVVLVYLVPNKIGAFNAEYNSLEKIVRKPHGSALISWADTISGILYNLIHEGPSDDVVISQRTLLVLEMLYEFIIDRFKGYNFMHRVKKSGEYSRFSYAELREKGYGFVGVENGMGGLMKLSPEAIRSRMFPFDTIKVNVFWIPLNEFLAVAERRLSDNSVMHNVQHYKRRGAQSPGFMGKYDAASIYEMVCAQKDVQFYIGIKGGERAFSTMSAHEIENMSPKQVTTGEQPNSQWIPGERFRQIYEDKFPERKRM